MNLKLLLALAGTCAALPALAQNMMWMDQSAMSRMTKQDMTIFLAATRTALAEPDGTTTTWTNPATGATGTITPVSTFKEKGMTCRSAKFWNKAGGIDGVGSDRKLCKVGGQWKLVS